MRGGVKEGRGLIWLFILIGAVCGSLIGDIIGNNVRSLNFLNTSYSIGTASPLTLNLKFMVLTLGINFNVNIMTVIGIILAIILYRKY